ncbi:MAG: hypothetical protein Q9164_007516, partial [Protoblastenia rupestris]
LIRANIGVAPGHDREGHAAELEGEQWIQEIVRLLDMAVIMAGAPGREGMVEEVLVGLQEWVEMMPLRKKRKRKRERSEDVFSRGKGRHGPRIEHPITRRFALSMEQFARYLSTGEPLVITDAIAHWPAFHERPWKSPEYLLKKTFGGRRLIPVELGRSYTDAGWGQSIITFKEFINRYMLRSDNEGGAEDIAYLAQHDLFAQIPSLRNDISVPDYCYTDPPQPAPGTPLSRKPAPEKLDGPLLNAWFGPAGTVSPLHTDPYHNILCQVVGRKYVRLYSPEESENLYPRGTEGGGVDMSNTSEVDVEGDVDEMNRKFPLFREAKYVETVLEEGECLYIPIGWWHYIKGLSVSFSVSFWWN